MIRTIVAATDGSDAALAAVRTAADLTKSLGPDAKLHVVAVVDHIAVPGPLGKHPPGVPDLLREPAQEALTQASEAASELGVQAETHLCEGEVVESILGCAQSVGADLIVAGFHGRNRLARLVMGSIVGNLVRSTTLPVTVVRFQAPETA